MTTLTARHSLGFAPSQHTHCRAPSTPATSAAVAGVSSRVGWIERLANWADRQPVHHRVGSWVLYR